jgi:uncharacterized alkaline shock family protein YloU
MQNDPKTPTRTAAVTLPPTRTEQLPADADTVTVAARTAAVAAIGVAGVHHLGGFAARAADQVRARLGRSASTAGVQVDDQDGRLDVRVAVVVEYPHPVHDVADAVRTQVRHALDQLPSAGPAQVDVTVIDVHGPFDDEPTPASRAAVRDTSADVAAAVRDAAANRTADAATAAGSTAADAPVADRPTAATQTDAADALEDAAVSVQHAAEAVRTDAGVVDEQSAAHEARQGGSEARP